MKDVTPTDVAAQLEARNGNAEEKAAAVAVLAGAIAEAIALGPAKATAKTTLDDLRPSGWAEGTVSNQ